MGASSAGPPSEDTRYFLLSSVPLRRHLLDREGKVQQYDVSGRPPNVLLQLEAAAHRRGYNRIGILGTGENERTFEGHSGCLAAFMLGPGPVRVTAVEQGRDSTRLLVSAHKRRHERDFDDLLIREFDATRVN